MKSKKPPKSIPDKGNKEQFRRWHYLDQYLSNRSGYKVQQLLDMLNEKLEQDSIRKRNGELKKVSLRTLYDDLNSMQDIFGDRIQIDKINGLYRYEDSRMSIFQTRIGQEEYNRLITILNHAKKNITAAIYEETESMIDRLYNPLNVKIHNKKDFQSFIKSSTQSSLEQKWLNSLIEIIDAKQSIQITYRKSNQDVNQYNLTPLGLKENLGIWYMVAYDHGEKVKRPEKTYRIARIISLIKTQLERPEEINLFNLEDYFRFSTGIHQEGNESPSDVVLEVSDKKIIDELKEHPLNETQRLKSEIDGVDTFVAKCYISYELVNQILVLGPNVKIIHPKLLRDKLVKKASEHLLNYQKEK